MFKLSKTLFSFNDSKIVKTNEVKIGSKYKLNVNENNPFRKETTIVLVKDVSNGWVLYDMNPHLESSFFKNESMEIDRFLSIYKLVGD